MRTPPQRRALLRKIYEFRNIYLKNIELCMKRVRITEYELILKLEGALRLRIISGPYLTQQMFMKGPKTRINLIKGFHERLSK